MLLNFEAQEMRGKHPLHQMLLAASAQILRSISYWMRLQYRTCELCKIILGYDNMHICLIAREVASHSPAVLVLHACNQEHQTSWLSIAS